MKSVLSLATAGLLLLSTSVFAATPPATPAATAPAATVVQPAPAVKETRAERKAEKKQIEATEKAAMAECKKLKGDEKKACKKEAEAQEKVSKAELKAKK
jgi:Skp family chaperone for outer membrane proteins